MTWRFGTPEDLPNYSHSRSCAVIVSSVPPSVCDNCGEAFVVEEIARKLHQVAADELKKGVEIEIVHFAA